MSSTLPNIPAMSTANHLQRIVIAGASGNLGQSILSSLLPSTSPAFEVTAITRPDSTASLPSASNLKIARGSLEDLAFLTSTLKGNDVLIVALGFAAPPEHTTNLFRAAADAGVPYVFPTEFGSDTTNKKLTDQIPMLHHKIAWRTEIENLGVSKWIAVVTNPWLDYGLMAPAFGIDIKAKTATLWTGPNVVKAYTTTLAQVGRAVGKMLSLPLKSEGAGKSVEDYANGFLYVNSFDMTQKEMLEGVQGVVGKDGWVVKERDLEEGIKEGKQMLKDGNRMGAIVLIYSTLFEKGVGDAYCSEPENKDLGLPEENFEDVIKEVVKKLGA